MDRLIELIGHLIPESASTFRIKLYLVGVGCLIAGVLTMAIPGRWMVIRGVGITACGAVLLGLGSLDTIRAERRRAARETEERIRAGEERIRIAEADRRARERQARESACDGHQWRLDQQALDLDVWEWVCWKCGSRRDTRPDA